MSVITNAIALLSALKAEDVQALPPFERRRLADILTYWAKIAEPREAPKSGVLSHLERGERAH